MYCTYTLPSRFHSAECDSQPAHLYAKSHNLSPVLNIILCPRRNTGRYICSFRQAICTFQSRSSLRTHVLNSFLLMQLPNLYNCMKDLVFTFSSPKLISRPTFPMTLKSTRETHPFKSVLEWGRSFITCLSIVQTSLLSLYPTNVRWAIAAEGLTRRQNSSVMTAPQQLLNITYSK